MNEGLEAFRPAPASSGGMVVAGNSYAAAVAARILDEGGNAFDAALAGSAVLAVTIPHMNGLGGDAFGLLYSADRNEVIAVNGSGCTPRRATTEAYTALGYQSVPTRGPLSISIPGLVSAWGALSSHATLALSRLLGPGIALALAGFAVPRDLATYAASGEYERLLATAPDLRSLYGGPGSLAEPGARLSLPALGATLNAIAESGTGAFYEGPIAERLAADLRQAGALIEPDDLARHDCLIQHPIQTATRLGTLFTCPPNTQGFVLNLIVALLEADNARPEDADYLERFLAAKSLAFQRRDALLGDPASFATYGALVDLGALQGRSCPQPRPVRASGAADTTCLVVMDRWGNAASWVQSLFDDFGSGVASLGSGVVFQNRLSLARLEPGHAASLAPRLRPPHTLCPALVMDGSRVRLALATPGGHGQAQVLAQIMMAFQDHPADALQRIVEAPRICQESDGEVLVEDRIAAAQVEAVLAAGYSVRRTGPWGKAAGTANALGAVLAIGARDDGTLIGAADPRRDGYAIPACLPGV